MNIRLVLVRSLVAAAVATWSVIAAAQPAPAATVSNAAWKLSNGLEVAYVQVSSSQLASVQLWYRAGSKDEAKKARGLARVTQRMAQMGSKRVRPRGHARLIAQVGGRYVGATTEDASSFSNVVPTGYEDFALRLEAERMQNLTLRKEGFDTVIERMAKEYEVQSRDPFKRAVWEFLGEAYKRHPYAWEATGTTETLTALKLGDVQRFYETYYVPNNALVVVVSPKPEAEIKKLVERHFGSVPAAKSPPRQVKVNAEPEQNAAREATGQPATMGMVVQGYHIPAAADKDMYAIQLLSVVMGVGTTSRLTRALVTEGGLADQAGASALAREHPGLFVMYASFSRPAEQDKIARRLTDVISRYQTTPVTPRELAGAKARVASNFYFATDNVDGLGEHIGTSWVLTRRPMQFLKDVAAIQGLAASDLLQVAKKYFTKPNRTTYVMPMANR